MASSSTGTAASCCSVRRQAYWLVLLSLVVAGTSVASETKRAAFFRERVAPIFTRHCLRCHNESKREGDLSLQSAQDVLDSGYLIPGDARSSRLVEVLTGVDGSRAEMPKQGRELEVAEVAAIRVWINDGAEWAPGDTLAIAKQRDDWWSFQPIRRWRIPRDHARESWARTAMDTFVLEKLHEHDLQPSVGASRLTLIRRLSFDLTGLPPTPEEIAAFVKDSEPLAYERLVDRLLASPHYGERWGRHWLDVVKYADTCGYDKDKLRPNSWPYRDYVIRSFNSDKPYGQFVEEQLAGDVLFPGTEDGVLGLGFLAAGPWDFIGHVEVSESKIDGQIARNLDRDEMVTNTFNTFSSVTVQCARCHHHKFDPLSQRQYYQLQAVFAAIDRAERPYGLDIASEERYRELTERVASESRRQTDLEKRLQAAGGAARLHARGKKAEAARSEELSERSHARADLVGADVDSELAACKERLAAARNELAAIREPRVVYAGATHFESQGGFRPTLGRARVIRVLHRGNVQQPGEEVGPGAPAVLTHSQETFSLARDHTEGERRAALARWFTRPDHPLTWRSIANRLWHYHFGQGIVRTPNDFGRMGDLPTHRKLLDWLATDLRDGGQTLKRVHRLIVTSSVYRQASDNRPASSAVDASNRFLWRMNRRRLSAEEIRDAILSVSGRLNRQMGGPGYYLFVLEKTEHSPHYEYHKFDPTDTASHRRTVYRFIARSQPDPYMATLDCADSSQSTPRRMETLTSLQALSLLNSRFNLAMSEYFASSLAADFDDPAEQVVRAMYLVTGRRPAVSEQRELEAYVAEHGLTNLCRLLFNLSEFVFLD